MLERDTQNKQALWAGAVGCCPFRDVLTEGDRVCGPASFIWLMKREEEGKRERGREGDRKGGREGENVCFRIFTKELGAGLVPTCGHSSGPAFTQQASERERQI